MRVLTDERGTPLWRELHHRRVSASDAEALLARRDSKRYRSLVERLVLDFEVPDHRTEHPDPWHETHEERLRAGLAEYRRRTRQSVLATGLCAADTMPWLCASPHGLIGHRGCVHIRPRRSMRSFHSAQGEVSERERARLELVMFVCDREWIDVVDYWDGEGRVPDLFNRKRMTHSFDWLGDNVLPRLITLWQDVKLQRQARGTVTDPELNR